LRPDYVVVGSGAGGGPLAARLAERGAVVVVLEAGGLRGGYKDYHYNVPALHGLATEDPDLRWDFFVRHYADITRQRADGKYNADKDGVYYPRCATVGGCTGHNAMITVYPHNRDWDDLAALLGDASWNADNMRRLFERLERCQYRNPDQVSRHGYDGWLGTQMADATLALGDPQLVKLVIDAAAAALVRVLIRNAQGDVMRVWSIILQHARTALMEFLAHDPLAIIRLGPEEILRQFVGTRLDPNDWQRTTPGLDEGVFEIPLATRQGQRNGSREFLLAIQAKYPDRLYLETDALATRVLFQGKKAVGVEYLKGQRLYRADRSKDFNPGPGQKKEIRVGKEVILSGGAFNTPQLLLLSGVGPAGDLKALGFKDGEIVADRTGVGKNLQDRYEVGIGVETTDNFSILAGCGFKSPTRDGEPADPCLTRWEGNRTGLYTTNGAVLGIILRSRAERPDPDLFIFGLPATFPGYFVGYSEGIAARTNMFTWAILKAHTNNAAGFVRLRNRDPQDTPVVNFKYFDEGNDARGEDLDSVLAGVQFVRDMAGLPQLAGKVRNVNFLQRGGLAQVDMDSDDAIRTFVKNEAWGHHACGTCRMGKPDDPGAVVDKDFRVLGVEGLRVVDASIFPKIPGMFIVTPVYMIAEKAADSILPQ
jgi:choline dehydrogenase